MNKKVIKGIIIAVVAAVLAVAIILVVTKVFFKKDESSNLSDTSSSIAEIKEGVLTLSSADASAGEEFDVTLTFEQNPGIWAVQLMLEYDSNVFEYVDYSDGDIFTDYEINETENMLRGLIMPDGLEDTKENGKVVELTFKVKDGVKAGDYPITISDGTMLCNVDEVTVSPKKVNSVVTVK